MISFLEVGSLVLGVMAWILAGAKIVKCRNGKSANSDIISITSLSACAVSVLFQLHVVKYFVESEEMISIMDTIHMSVLASTVIIGVTVILNITAIVMRKNRTK